LLFAEIQQNQQKSAKKCLLISAEQNSKTYAYHDILMKQLSFQRKISKFYQYIFIFLEFNFNKLIFLFELNFFL
jgi:hypothetical protein